MLQPIHTGNVRDRSFEFGTIVDTLRARQSPLAVATASSSASGTWTTSENSNVRLKKKKR